MTNKKVAELDVEFIDYKAEAKASMDALEIKIDDVKLKKGAKNMVTIHLSPTFHHTVKSRGKFQSNDKKDNSRYNEQNGRVKLVISKALIGSPKQGGHVEEGKHKRKLGFALESLIMKAQELHNGLPR
ncbi:hypothetical protein Tco_1498083 [Tanacetum coccineum]